MRKTKTTKTISAHVTSTWVYDNDIEVEVPVDATEEEIDEALTEEAENSIENVADFSSGVNNLDHEFSDIEEVKDERDGDLHPGDEATLYEFADEVLKEERDHIFINTFTTPDGHRVEWYRSTYSRDRIELDYFEVRLKGQFVTVQVMTQEMDEDKLKLLAKRIKPTHAPKGIVGTVSYSE